MKLFAVLSAVAAAEAALSSVQEAAAKKAFNTWDHDHKGDLTSGGVYAALSSLDKKLTETQLEKAAGQKKTVNLEQFLDIYSKLEGGVTIPKGCKNFFDGCNHCIIQNGKEIGCTEMFCAKNYDAPEKQAFCTVYEDGRQCKSATDCSESKQINCFTREVWSDAKKAYCCKTRQMGCSPTKTALKGGDVCYAFSEMGDTPNVDRKNDCPKGYKCASGMAGMGVSFNSVMHCTKEAAGTGIPAGCTSWYDGCNSCSVINGQKGACTKMMCFRQGKAYCKSFGNVVQVHA